MKAAVLLVLATGLAFTMLPSAAPVAAQPIGNPTPSPPPTAGSHPHPSPLQPLEDRIGYLGETQYASTYAGVTLAAGTLSVYVVRQGDAPFLKAVAALDAAHLPYSVQYVTRSLATQEATSTWISDHLTAIRAEGISPQWWGGENAQDAVRVALKGQVTSTQLAHLQTAMTQIRNGGLGQRALQLPTGTAVTPGNYSTVAAAVLNAQAPSPDDIVAGPSNLGAGHASNDWQNDNSPFYEADKLWYTLNNTNYCTGGFNVSGGGTNYMLTASHCSGEPPATGHDFYTCYTKASNGNCNYNVGKVQKAYWSKQDFELLNSSNRNYLGYIYNDSTDYIYSEHGWIDAEAGNYICADGVHGEHCDIYVTQGGASTCVWYDSHETCHALVIESSIQDCPPGDSGGPMFQRTSDGYHVNAAGIILGYDNTGSGDFCYGQQIYWIRQNAGVGLIWGN